MAAVNCEKSPVVEFAASAGTTCTSSTSDFSSPVLPPFDCLPNATITTPVGVSLGDANARVLKPTDIHYGSKQYWNQRYQRQDKYDWFADFGAFATTLEPALRRTDKILVTGCGNSLFSEQLYRAGYRNLVNIDYSSVVINQMREKYRLTMSEMRWEVVDCYDMRTLESEQFDVVLDKSTLDCICCDGEEQVYKYVNQCYNVVKSGGLFIVISFSEFRDKYFMSNKWKTLMQPVHLIPPLHDLPDEASSSISSDGCTSDTIVCSASSSSDSMVASSGDTSVVASSSSHSHRTLSRTEMILAGTSSATLSCTVTPTDGPVVAIPDIVFYSYFNRKHRKVGGQKRFDFGNGVTTGTAAATMFFANGGAERERRYSL